MQLKIKRLHKDAILPTYAHSDDAGMDLYCVESFTIEPGERKSIPTGLAFEVPDGYVGLIWDKSGLSHKYGFKTLGGVLDAGYRGELLVGIMKRDDTLLESVGWGCLVLLAIMVPLILSWLAKHLRGDWW